MKLASYIDHTLLSPIATNKQVETLCGEAIEHGFASVCVHPYYVPLCKECIGSNNIAICTVVGFPFGANNNLTKIFEASQAIQDGATEIDIVMNLPAFKNGDSEAVYSDILSIKAICKEYIVKVIIETAYLSKQAKIDACRICIDAGADFVKTSTGYGPTGATVDDVVLLKDTAAGAIKVKAAGGIKTRAFAKQLIQAGADRLGTSSAMAIIKG
ncbi:MAG: deoxyribose-phosphate aldolase [candidate division Zixibacteria bacterium]|nr:deoxyribose-phosphate aldolase [candidate division Zixibacteria bacterium]